MAIASLSIPADYWDKFQINDDDLEFLYNLLLDLETPLTPQELVRELVSRRIHQEITALEKQQTSKNNLYAPKDHYEIGQTLKFPALNWAEGKVANIRAGRNPEYAPFEVIDVLFSDGEQRSFAASFEAHSLNQLPGIDLLNPIFDPDNVQKTYGKKLVARLMDILEDNPDIVEIAGRWFPRALLVDVNQGHLNLAEAVLEVENGGPLTTSAILSQIELPTDVNIKLTEFSLNLALQEDGRFDEVGPAGETLWFLHRMEPEGVQTPPIWLRPTPIEIDPVDVSSLTRHINADSFDELEPIQVSDEDISELTITLIYPHWRAGTLPLTSKIAHLFPTAYESPRVQFTFVDGDTGNKFNGWVVRPNKYIYGLRDWFLSLGLLPGSLIKIKRGVKPGEVILDAGKRRPVKDWVRTALIGTDGGIVFALLKQQITTMLDEHMGIVLSNPELLDVVWENPKSKQSFEQLVHTTMLELSKLNPQGHVHAEELYAAVNLRRRVQPTAIVQLLTQCNWAAHLGDLYFRIVDNSDQGESDE